MATERTVDQAFLQAARAARAGKPLPVQLTHEVKPLVADRSFAASVAHNLHALLSSIRAGGNSWSEGNTASSDTKADPAGKGSSQR